MTSADVAIPINNLAYSQACRKTSWFFQRALESALVATQFPRGVLGDKSCRHACLCIQSRCSFQTKLAGPSHHWTMSSGRYLITPQGATLPLPASENGCSWMLCHRHAPDGNGEEGLAEGKEDLFAREL